MDESAGRRRNERKRIRRLAVRAGVLLALTSLCSSCQAAFDYPSEESENTADACSDATDNDFDGLIDCADPDCDGRCPEGDDTTCADGRDNDGDGKADARDPRCWHLQAPSVVRCASTDPVDFEEPFDAQISDQRWFPFGLEANDGTAIPLVQPPQAREDRPDGVLGFALLPSADQVPTGLLSTDTFSGDWRSFSLAFQARVVPPGRLHVALVPAGSGAVTTPQSPELAPILIEIDGPSGVLQVTVNGSSRSGPWPAGSDWHALELIADGGAPKLTLDRATVMQLEPVSLAKSRVAIWGVGDGKAEGVVQVDDLELQLAGAFPCGVAVPQMPLGPTCRLGSSAMDTNAGYTVSVASHESGGHCAVVTTGPVGQDVPDGAQSWISEQGASWELGGTLPFSHEAGRLEGVGVARDTQASLWRAALTWNTGDAAYLGVSSSPDCGQWTEPVMVAPLPLDAQAPSYLIPGVIAPYEVYFTRPGVTGQGASLWRLMSEDEVGFVLEEQPVTVFDVEANVAGPAALTRAGNDVLLVHKVAQSTGLLGVGLWVAADDALTTWRRADRWPLLEADPARGEFDADVVLAGTILWEGGNPTLLYGALGKAMASSVNGSQTSTITTGSALLHSSGAASPSSLESASPGSCGNGTCGQEEDCDTCPVDCGVCDGESVVVERFGSADAWEWMGLADDDALRTSMYVSTLSERLTMAFGPPAWLSRELDAPLQGDFELSLDIRVTPPSDLATAQRCTALVGLALPDTTRAVDASGLFLQIDRQLPCSNGAPAFAPQMRVRGKKANSLAPLALIPGSGSDCAGAATGYAESRQRVRLTRRGGQLSASVSVPGLCDWRTQSASLDYMGPFDGFDRLVVGWDRSAQPKGLAIDCGDPSAWMSIDNVVVRTLPCDEESRCTDPETGGAFCTDLASSPEHCGACFAPVGLAQRCSGGVAICGETECDVPGEAQPACVDLQTDSSHCGACNASVGPLEACKNGLATGRMVPMPERFSIDATTVTRSQYAAWLATEPATAEQLPECSWNETFEPACGWPPAERGNWPVVCVDWCDASGYCASIGKRLCGRIGGGSESGSGTTPDDQWYAACSSGGKNDYPYGPEYDAVACNGIDLRPPDAPYQCALTLPVASLPTCQSSEPGYEGVYDLAGNVDEWADGCASREGEGDMCKMAVKNSCLQGSCAYRPYDERVRATQRLGFRCCSL